MELLLLYCPCTFFHILDNGYCRDCLTAMIVRTVESLTSNVICQPLVMIFTLTPSTTCDRFSKRLIVGIVAAADLKVV